MFNYSRSGLAAETVCCILVFQSCDDENDAGQAEELVQMFDVLMCDMKMCLQIFEETAEIFTFVADFFIFSIKRNAQISKATTYKWPYNSNSLFVLV